MRHRINGTGFEPGAGACESGADRADSNAGRTTSFVIAERVRVPATRAGGSEADWKWNGSSGFYSAGERSSMRIDLCVRVSVGSVYIEHESPVPTAGFRLTLHSLPSVKHTGLDEWLQPTTATGPKPPRDRLPMIAPPVTRKPRGRPKVKRWRQGDNRRRNQAAPAPAVPGIPLPAFNPHASCHRAACRTYPGTQLSESAARSSNARPPNASHAPGSHL